jgi:hypothetical protein
MEGQFSTPSKDCIQDGAEEVAVEAKEQKPKTKTAERQTPDISHLVYVKRVWKAELLLSNGMTREFACKADELNDFLNIISEKFKKGYKIVSIIGGG